MPFDCRYSECELHMKDKPILLIANKADLDSAAPVTSIVDKLQPSQLSTDASCIRHMDCIAHPKRNGGQLDARIEEGFDWMLQMVVDRYDEIDARVEFAKAEMEKKRVEAEQASYKRVMAKILQEKSFPETGEPQECFRYRARMYAGAREGVREVDCGRLERGVSCSNASTKLRVEFVFDRGCVSSVEDGLEFLAQETNLHDPSKENQGLPDVGVTIARLVGYQKVALQMCGSLVCPISKKKKKHTWEEVLEYVKDRREEAGLHRDG